MNGPSDFSRTQANGLLAFSVPSAAPRTKSTCLNLPLIAILLVGTVIVIADGFTRPLVLEEDWESSEAMTYEPYHAAFVFGLVVLPLMMAYGKTVGISKKESALLWFVMCTVAYSKDFAYMGVPGAPIFVTDLVLGGLSLALVGSLVSGLKGIGTVPRLGLICLFVSGAISAGRGFLSGQDKILVLRDFALVAYSMFVVLSFLVITSWDAVRRIFLFFALGALFSTVNALAWMVMQPGQRRYLPYGAFVLAALLGMFVLTTHRIIRPALGWMLSGMLAVGVLLANARTIYVAFGAVLPIMFIVGPSAKLQITRRTLRLSAAVVLTLVLLVWAAWQTKEGADLLETTATELISGTVHYEDDPNAGFRFLAWMEAGQRFEQNPLLGEGFGVPFSFDLTSFDVRPHNTFLTILYKTGLVGFISAMLLLIGFQWQGWTTLRSFRGQPGTLFLYLLLLAQLVASVFGCLNLLLESPFLASVYWIILGVGFRVVSLIRSSPYAIQQIAAPRLAKA